MSKSSIAFKKDDILWTIYHDDRLSIREQQLLAQKIVKYFE